MYISPDISVWSLVCVCTSFICVLLLVLIYALRVRNVTVYRRRADSERPDKPDSEYLPASVIIYSQGDADALMALTRSVLAQDYPAPFEVIVVNEGESADIRDTVSMLRASHPNIYLTFTPEGVVNLSRKKLALTLGIKAARYDIVVLTTTAAEIPSDQWLRRMMSRFNAGSPVDIVLGFSFIDPEEDDNAGKRKRAFDYVADSVRWIGAALAGHPFRGLEYNLAYRKEAFMANKGFHRTLNLHYGDDDIFISEIARGDNTEIELSEDSIVRLRYGNNPRIFNERELRHIFTESFIRRRPRVLFSLTGWLQIAAIALAIAGAVIAYPNMAAAIIGLLLIIGMAVADILFWRKAMKALKSRTLLLTLPWLSATYPLRKLARRVRSKLGKQKKYTWT